MGGLAQTKTEWALVLKVFSEEVYSFDFAHYELTK